MATSTQVNRPHRPPTYDGVLRSLLAAAAGEPLPQWDIAEAAIMPCRVAHGATLFHQDAVHPFVYAVRRGLLKLLYLDEDGNEWIKSFVQEGQFFASIAAIESAGRTSFMVVAIEDSEVERIAYATVSDLAAKHLPWSRALARLALAFAARKERRERELLTLSPEQRYRAFAADYPNLEQRIAQKDLARHLGLTPVGMNRIVSRVRRGADVEVPPAAPVR